MIRKTIRQVTLGKIKMWQQRLSTYVALINFVMIFYLFITENKWVPWYVWVFMLGFLTFSLVLVDTLYIMPDQLAYSSRKNPEWCRMIQNQKRIMEALNLESVDDR